jgi:hypothetical protein
MSELPSLLMDVAQAAKVVHELDAEIEAARAVLYEKLRAAHEAGASYALLGRIAGISRQGVAKALRQ